MHKFRFVMRFKIIFMGLLLAACTKKQDYASVRIIGHACNGLEINNSIYHDNSFEAAELALSIDGCQGIEVDVQLSADGTLFLYHDPDLSSETDASSCVPSTSDVLLSEVRYKTIHKESLASLQKTGTLLINGKTILLDLRHYNNCTQESVNLNLFIQKIQSWQQQLNSGVSVLTVTNNELWLGELKNAGFTVIFSSESMEKTNFIIENYSCDGFIMKNEALTKADVEKLKANHKKVIIFEVRSPKGIRKALKKLPDYLVTDDIRATIIEKY